MDTHPLVTSNNPIRFGYETIYSHNVSLSFEDGSTTIRGADDGGLQLVNGPLRIDNLYIDPISISSTSDLCVKVARIEQSATEDAPFLDLQGTTKESTLHIPAYRFAPGKGSFDTLAEFQGNVKVESLCIGNALLSSKNDMIEFSGLKCSGLEIKDNEIQISNFQMSGDKIDLQERLTFAGIEDFRLVPKNNHVSFSLFALGESWASANVEALQIGTTKEGFRIETRNHGAGKTNHLELSTNSENQIQLDEEGVHIYNVLHCNNQNLQVNVPIQASSGFKSNQIDVNRVHFPFMVLSDRNKQFVVIQDDNDLFVASSNGVKVKNCIEFENSNGIIQLSLPENNSSYKLQLPPHSPKHASLLGVQQNGSLHWIRNDIMRSGNYDMINQQDLFQDLPGCKACERFYYDVRLKFSGNDINCIFTFSITHLDTWDIVDLKSFSKGKTPQVKVNSTTGQIQIKTHLPCSIEWIIQ
jgi:hypothetical protein